MRNKITILKYFFVFSCFCVSVFFYAPSVYAQTKSLNQLLDEWQALAKSRNLKAAKQIYDQAMSEIPLSVKANNPKVAAEMFLEAATLCRDLNDLDHAIILFELALSLSPNEPNYHRIYGDYLLGYRGLKEQAWFHLQKAKALAEQDPEGVDDSFRWSLQRSIEIFHRDVGTGAFIYGRGTGSGALLFENDKVTVTGGFDTRYQNMAKDPLGLNIAYARTVDMLLDKSSKAAIGIVRLQNELNQLNAFDAQLNDLLIENGGTVRRNEPIDVPYEDGTPRTVTTIQSRNAIARTDILDRLETLGRSERALVGRQTETADVFMSMVARGNNPSLPVLRFSYSHSQTFEESLNFDDLDRPADSITEGLALALEKTFIVRNDMFLEADVGLLYQDQQTQFEIYTDENEFIDSYKETSDYLYLIGAANLRKEWGMNDGVLQLKINGQFQHDVLEIDGDPGHLQVISLRNSSYYNSPFGLEEVERFRGRRSSSQEIGLTHNVTQSQGEGRFPADTSVTITDEPLPDTRSKSQGWSIYVSNEELGLFNGVLDLYTTYIYRELSLTGTRFDTDPDLGDIPYSQRIRPLFGVGDYSMHELRIEPIWLPVFELYTNSFKSGWENVNVAFPMRLSQSEGPFDRVTGSIKVSGQRVFSKPRLRLDISAAVEIAHYTELDADDDVGGFIRFSLY